MNRLKELRKEKGYTLEKVASRLNIGTNTLSQYETGKREANYEMLNSLAEFYGVSIDYLLGKESKVDRNAESVHFGHTTRIPVLGVIPAGTPIEAVEDIIEYIDIPADWLNRGSYFALLIRGNSMTPRINNGDTVIFRQQDDAESGQICAVMVNGDDATVKKIKKEATGIWLIPENPACDFEPTFFSNKQIEELPVRVIGLAVEIRRKI